MATFFPSFFLFLVEGQRSLVTRFSFPSRLLISLSGFVVSGKTVVPLRGGGAKEKKKKEREGREKRVSVFAYFTVFFPFPIDPVPVSCYSANDRR